MRISEKTTALLISQKIVQVEDKEIYEYGFDLILADLFNFSMILFVGGACGQLVPAVMYLLVFVGLRSFCGGYHAKTHLRCHIVTIGVFVFFLILLNMPQLTDRKALLLWGDFIALIPVLLFSPITHANKPLSEDARKRNRLLSIGLFLLMILCAIILTCFGRQEGTVISLTLWIVSLCMIPAIDIRSLKERKKS